MCRCHYYRCHGCPKGHELTTIGLPEKKYEGGKLCAFTKLPTSDKENVSIQGVMKGMLMYDYWYSWLVC